MDYTIPNWLMQRAYLTPHRPGLVFKGQTWSFKDMFHVVKTTAGKLASLSLTKGSRGAILMKNSPEMVWVIHAFQQLGVEAILLNHRLTAKELSFQIEDSEAAVFIYGDSFANVVPQINRFLTKDVEMVSCRQLERLPRAEHQLEEEYCLSDVCSIMYTSGTTGKPKGVMQSYGNHWWSAAGSSINIGLNPEDTWLCAVPLYHISGYSILMRSVIYGNTVYLMEKFEEETVNAYLNSGKISIMSVVSNMLQRMVNLLGPQSYHPQLRCVLLGGGPAPRPLLEKCKEKNIPVFQTYGMTETASQIVTCNPEDSLTKLGSAGKPLFPVQVKIVIDGKEARPGETGEIAVKGPNVSKGYLNRRSANEESFNNGWFLTGDLGYIDKEGYLYVIDRRSDLIISGGENIYPAEIEEVLLSHESVLEAGVTGIEDDKWGQVPYGFVVVNKPVSEEELQKFCRENLASYKIPKRIYIIEKLPRNATSKLMRRYLVDYIPN